MKSPSRKKPRLPAVIGMGNEQLMKTVILEIIMRTIDVSDGIFLRTHGGAGRNGIMKRNTKKVLLGTGIAAAGIAAMGMAFYCVTKSFVKIALDREGSKRIDKEKERMSDTEDFSDFMGEVISAAKKLENSSLQEVETVSHDGFRLVGHWRPHKSPKRILLAMHGWRSSWSQGFGLMADFWDQSGCSVLFAEQRGQNNSGGDYMGFGLLERHDCLAWLRWINSHTGGGAPIYLVGVSMGAAAVLMAAGLNLPGNVRGIIADCGFTSPHGIWRHVVKNRLHLPYGLWESAADDLCRKKLQVGAKDYSSVEAMRECTVPVLFIHGTDDRFVPIEMTYENYRACAAPKRLFVVPGAGHAMSYYTNKSEYEKNMNSFWRDYD